MRRNPHRNSWLKAPGDTAYTCRARNRDGNACGFEARTPQQKTSHADHFEIVTTRGPR